MPYINSAAKISVDSHGPSTPGELNYAITKLVLEYLPATPSYADLNCVVGVLESAKLEFYRKMISKYEDQKCFENGEVYPCDQN